MKSARYALLDFIRGFALINMILYHLIWDLVHIFGVKMAWYTSQPGRVWQQCICCTFIFLSGFCWNLSKRKVKRGIEVLAISFGITAVTAIFMPENLILFGVLTLIGSASLILALLDRFLAKINEYAGLVATMVAFVLTRYVTRGILSFGTLWQIRLPKIWYANFLTAYLGFPPRDFVSQDYFPIIPWTFLFAAGYFFYRIIVKRNGWIKPLTVSLSPIIEWCGRNSLIIYVIHQPIIYAVLKVIFLLT